MNKRLLLKSSWFPLVNLFLIFLILAIYSCVANAAPAKLYKILRVPDGDTIVIMAPCRYRPKELCAETIRMIGINTPEMPHFGKPLECFGTESRDMLKTVIQSEDSDGVVVERHGKDKFGRTLAYIFIPLTTPDVTEKLSRLRINSVNYFMVKWGYAKAETRFPHKYLKDYVAAEKFAQNPPQGIWSLCTRKSFGGKW